MISGGGPHYLVSALSRPVGIIEARLIQYLPVLYI